MPTARRDLPTARMTSPGEVVALVPTLCGFTPSESLVVVSLRGRRGRIGLTVRCDLPRPADEVALADEVSGRIAHDGASGVLLVVHTEETTPRARTGLVDAVAAACRRHGLEVREALLVNRGRWTSYLCDGPGCCPAEGTPVDRPPTPALRLVAAEAALQGRAVLASREELVASVAPPSLLLAARAEQQLDRAAAEWVASLARDGREDTQHVALRAARDLLDRGAEVPVAEAAALAVAVHDVVVRDQMATWALDRYDELLALLLQVVRHVVPGYDAPVCALLAWVAYAGGDGALANVALARALTSDPDYPLARLLQQGVQAQVSPDEVRDVLKGTRRLLSPRSQGERPRRRTR